MSPRTQATNGVATQRTRCNRCRCRACNRAPCVLPRRPQRVTEQQPRTRVEAQGPHAQPLRRRSWSAQHARLSLRMPCHLLPQGPRRSRTFCATSMMAAKPNSPRVGTDGLLPFWGAYGTVFLVFFLVAARTAAARAVNADRSRVAFSNSSVPCSTREQGPKPFFPLVLSPREKKTKRETAWRAKLCHAALCVCGSESVWA